MFYTPTSAIQIYGAKGLTGSVSAMNYHIVYTMYKTLPL